MPVPIPFSTLAPHSLIPSPSSLFYLVLWNPCPTVTDLTKLHSVPLYLKETQLLPDSTIHPVHPLMTRGPWTGAKASLSLLQQTPCPFQSIVSSYLTVLHARKFGLQNIFLIHFLTRMSCVISTKSSSSAAS